MGVTNDRNRVPRGFEQKIPETMVKKRELEQPGGGLPVVDTTQNPTLLNSKKRAPGLIISSVFDMSFIFKRCGI